MKKFLNQLGPGVLVSAAFIGPGTVTVCTLAGVHFQYGLLWALVLSIVSCIVLQEMSARLGLISQKGLSECIREEIKNPIFRIFSLVLIFSAIVLGNAAYEAGNITGAVLGVEAFFGPGNFITGNLQINLWSFLIGGAAFIMLAIGNYKALERIFIALVILMSLSFLITAVITKPEIIGILKGFIPSANSAEILTVIALIGTTVVPYNLFLHASLVSEKWQNATDLPVARKELIVSIILGGLVSMAVVICGASSRLTEISSAADMAAGLEPLFGKSATFFMAMGLLAAGITSSVTAPLAAAYVVKGCLGWKGGMKSFRFKLVWAIVLLMGIFFSSLGLKPIQIIQFAQIANGILLPVIAFFLFWIVNQKSVLGDYSNTKKQNIIALLVLAIAFFLGVKSIYAVISNF
ncbi:Nramp family divalent metal transporter [Zunongwangia sp. F363]|uniref:Nramp family divalent metal transporter n=1 Tax=Autumnicola tepida TaxID=3075595 RepID=A0ABU3CDC6_9FLAO|nr:Nramp family divalent metal transporter [Zunongwangia sp. F363]MDT0644334.1 Nramp family divalent metal transporter [Zunongwangia sp. F363]